MLFGRIRKDGVNTEKESGSACFKVSRTTSPQGWLCWCGRQHADEIYQANIALGKVLQDWVCGELYVNSNEDIFLEIYFQTWKKTLEAICSTLIFCRLGNWSPEKWRHLPLWQIATLFPNSFPRASEVAPLCCTAPRAWFTQTAVTQFSMHNVWGVVFIKFWVQNFDYLLFVAIN